jgi:hypothetical protein
MFELIKDFNDNGKSLVRGEYSREELVKIYGGEGVFNYCFTCTSLKEVLIPIISKKETLQEKILDKAEEILDVIVGQNLELPEEEVAEEVMKTIYIAKENLKLGTKIVFRKDSKITYEQLVETFGADLSLISDKLIETKVSEDVSI